MTYKNKKKIQRKSPILKIIRSNRHKATLSNCLGTHAYSVSASTLSQLATNSLQADHAWIALGMLLKYEVRNVASWREQLIKLHEHWGDMVLITQSVHSFNKHLMSSNYMPVAIRCQSLIKMNITGP